MAKATPAGDWDQLRSALQALPGDGPFSVKVEPGADPKVAQQVSNLFEIALPDGEYLVGTDNARVVVAVNFRGQCFLENRPVQEAELNVELRLRLQTAARESRKLTLILGWQKRPKTKSWPISARWRARWASRKSCCSSARRFLTPGHEGLAPRRLLLDPRTLSRGGRRVLRPASRFASSLRRPLAPIAAAARPLASFSRAGRAGGRAGLVAAVLCQRPVGLSAAQCARVLRPRVAERIAPNLSVRSPIDTPSWLSLDATRLGTNFPAPAFQWAAIFPDLAQQQTLRLKPLPVFLAPEIVPAQRSRGTTKSSVSRRFVEATETALAELIPHGSTRGSTSWRHGRRCCLGRSHGCGRPRDRHRRAPSTRSRWSRATPRTRRS